MYTTLAARGRKALGQLAKLQFVPAAPHSKAKTIRTKIYLGASHGIESNDVSERDLGMMSAAVVDAFMCRNDFYDPDWFYMVRSEGVDIIDPVLQPLVTRCMRLRRSICKRPSTLQEFQRSIL